MTSSKNKKLVSTDHRLLLLWAFSSVALTPTASYAQNPLDQIIGGAINAARSQQAAAEWQKTSPLMQTCFNAALQGNRTNVNRLAQQGIGPNDPRVAPIKQSCAQFTEKKFRQNFECTLTAPSGFTVSTRCDEAFALQASNGTVQRITVEEAIRQSAANRSVVLGQFERPEALSQRQEREQDQLRQQQAQAAERQRVDQLEQERQRLLKSNSDRDRIARQQSDQQRLSISAATATSSSPSQNQSQQTASINMRIKDIGLGAPTSAACKPKPETYNSPFSKEPLYMIQNCTIVHSENDATDVFFSADQKQVVRVRRVQYLKSSDPDIKLIIEAAVKFYGTPSTYDEGNWLAMYGNSHTATYNGRNATVKQNATGSGLLIRGSYCGEGYGGVSCFPNSKHRLVYELINISAYESIIEAGKLALKEMQKQRSLNQKF